MNAIPPAANDAAPILQLDRERHLDTMAYVCLIDAHLSDATHISPSRAAGRLARQLEDSGRGEFKGDGTEMLTVTILGTKGSAADLTATFRDWQARARDRLALGPRK